MTKNSNKVIQDESSDCSAVRNLQDYVNERPRLLSVEKQVTSVTDVLRVLDGMKGGLVTVRGGRFQDQAFIIMEDDVDTARMHNILSTILPVSLIRPWDCSRFIQGLFYKKTRESVSEPGCQEANPDFVGDRVVMRVALPSSASAIYFCQSYLEVLLDFLSPVGFLPAQWGFDAYVRVSKWPVDAFVSYAKYCTAYPMAKFLKNELPKKPDGLENFNVFRGPIQKMIRARLCSFRSKSCASFFFTLLQGVKRACNVVPRVYIQKSLQDHMQVLSTPRPVEDSVIYDEFLTLAGSLVRGSHISSARILQWTSPSPNASFEASRTVGGQEAVVRKVLTESGILDFDGETAGGYNGHLPPEYGESIGEAFAVVKDLHRYLSESIMRELYSMHETPTGIQELRGQLRNAKEKRDLIYDQFTKTLRRPLDCQIVPLSEPLKVRTISAGSGVPYYLAKPFQKTVWSHLRRLPQFVVIGEPLQKFHLGGILDRESQLRDWALSKCDLSLLEKVDGLFVNFVSGDYKSATDLLKIEYTLGLFDVWTSAMLNPENGDYELHWTYVQLMRKLLEPHRLWYTGSDKLEKFAQDNNIEYERLWTDDGKSFIIVDQVTGQLMGSPISFPFLCGINLIGYWLALNRYLGSTVPLKLLPLLVNGDDILFRSNDVFYGVWLSVIEEIGFKLSLGKNYVHKYYLTINSELFHFSPNAAMEFVSLPFFNVGLLIAQSKGRLADPRRKLPLCDLYEWSVGKAFNKSRAHKRFIHYNRLVIEQMTDNGKYNLFLPVTLGGLGFPVYQDVKPEIRITNFQRRFAAFLYSRISMDLQAGIYRSGYCCALIADTKTISKTLVRKTGVPTLRWGSLVPEDGWELYSPASPLKTGPFSLTMDREAADAKYEYRYPPKWVIRQFNNAQHRLRKGQGTLCDTQETRAWSDSELLSFRQFVHRRVFHTADEEGETLAF